MPFIYSLCLMYGRLTTNDLFILADGVAEVRAVGGAGGHLQLPADAGICRFEESECGALFCFSPNKTVDHGHILSWIIGKAVATGTIDIISFVNYRSHARPVATGSRRGVERRECHDGNFGNIRYCAQLGL